MAISEIQPYLMMLPTIQRAPQHAIWVAYDRDADVLYINFTHDTHANDSELTDDDIIIRYNGDEVIGYTVLHVSTRVGVVV